MNDSASPLTAERQAASAPRSRARRIAQLLLQGDRPYALYIAFAVCWWYSASPRRGFSRSTTF
jgi:ribose transport system permease protein